MINRMLATLDADALSGSLALLLVSLLVLYRLLDRRVAQAHRHEAQAGPAVLGQYRRLFTAFFLTMGAALGTAVWLAATAPVTCLLLMPVVALLVWLPVEWLARWQPLPRSWRLSQRRAHYGLAILAAVALLLTQRYYVVHSFFIPLLSMPIEQLASALAEAASWINVGVILLLICTGNALWFTHRVMQRPADAKVPTSVVRLFVGLLVGTFALMATVTWTAVPGWTFWLAYSLICLLQAGSLGPRLGRQTVRVLLRLLSPKAPAFT